ncbi:hypothetical protein HU200_008455 [Digitaria exilis]|uniref:Uncharacterized protein n=1 Tax=Digitaria exilis TaxID=1010633 RepID=A0A835A9F4_9POAL|nr:hypothetical protein HU200_060897 [Digitaria exilis]KAF8765537.1 hypothetical protein HU200_008455 [Digitaria exilis]
MGAAGSGPSGPPLAVARRWRCDLAPGPSAACSCPASVVTGSRIGCSGAARRGFESSISGRAAGFPWAAVTTPPSSLSQFAVGDAGTSVPGSTAEGASACMAAVAAGLSTIGAASFGYNGWRRPRSRCVRDCRTRWLRLLATSLAAPGLSLHLGSRFATTVASLPATSSQLCGDVSATLWWRGRRRLSRAYANIAVVASLAATLQGRTSITMVVGLGHRSFLYTVVMMRVKTHPFLGRRRRRFWRCVLPEGDVEHLGYRPWLMSGLGCRPPFPDVAGENPILIGLASAALRCRDLPEGDVRLLRRHDGCY